MTTLNYDTIDQIIKQAFLEDIGEGDHSSLACVPADATGKAKLLVKENGIIAGVTLARRIVQLYDSNLVMETFIEDGSEVKIGDIVLTVSGPSRSILAT
jgi:nicotinate-nucleotide pyrophosphorylase (carboxylating)